MKNILHKNNWNQGTVKVHVEPPPIPLIKSNNDKKSGKYGVKNKFCRYSTPEKSDLYELKISLFDMGGPEELLFFIRNFNMTIDASGTLVSGANIQYLCTLVC